MSFSLGLSRGVSSNALIKLASEVVGRIASFGLVLWAAQQLGEAGFGLYNYGLALGFVLAQIADLGLQVLTAREIAMAGLAARPLVHTALRLKVLLSLPVILLLTIFTANWPGSLRLSLLLLGLTPLGQTYLEFVAYVFRGQQKMTVEAMILTAARLLTAVIGGLVLWLGGGLLGLALSSVGSTAVLVGWALRLLRQAGWSGERRGGSGEREAGSDVSRFTFHASRLSLYWRLLRQALPLGIAIFLSIAYTRLAVLMLQARLGEVAVARFSAAFRLIEPAQILPASLLAAAFPAFSYALRHNPPQARRLGTRVSLLLALLGGSVASAFWLAAPWLIPLLYGEAFVNSITILQILGLSTLPAFINYSLTHYLIARGQQAIMGLFTATMLALHAALSWYLIPLWGAAGPAASIILAESVLLLCCLLTLAVTKPKAVANQ